MKISIIGSKGIVGTAMKELFYKHYEIIEYDIRMECSREDANKCDVGIICVPTPMAEDGSCDTSIVEEAIGWLNTPLILIKSTVRPGFTDEMMAKYGKRIVFSPEYCGESKYYHQHFWNEIVKTPFFIFGGNKKDTKELVEIFAPVCGPEKFYGQTDAKTAEIVKYMENIYFAMKVIFANEFYEICERFSVDYWTARELWGLDPRVDKMHTAVFKKRGFGGKCYPKDLSALIEATKKIGYEPKFLMEIQESNKRFRK